MVDCWAKPSGAQLSVYLHGVHDPGNVGTVIRSAHALAGGPVILGSDCADQVGALGVGSLGAGPQVAGVAGVDHPGGAVGCGGGVGCGGVWGAGASAHQGVCD